MSDGAPEHPPLAGPQRLLATVALALANFMVVLDMTIANVSVPHIAGSLAVSPSQGTWVITSYAVAEAIIVPLTGWLAQRFGAVKVFCFAMAGFGHQLLIDAGYQAVGFDHFARGSDALAQAAPGPNMMVVALVGFRVAGVAGAVVATTAIVVPSSVLTLFVAGLWFRSRDAPWRKALQAGLQPVTAALIMASAVLLVWTASVDIPATLLLALATVLFLRTKLHPLLILGGAAALGAVGVVS